MIIQSGALCKPVVVPKETERDIGKEEGEKLTLGGRESRREPFSKRVALKSFLKLHQLQLFYVLFKYLHNFIFHSKVHSMYQSMRT